jgi:hypothetical protein
VPSQNFTRIESVEISVKPYHSRQLTIADQWRGRWRTEVGPLRRSVEAVNEAWQEDRRRAERGAIAQAFLKLWATVNTPSALQTSMSAEDVRFEPVPLPTSASGSNMFGSACALQRGLGPPSLSGGPFSPVRFVDGILRITGMLRVFWS